MRTGRIIALAVLAPCGFASSGAIAAPVQWPGNGQYYEAVCVEGGITWGEARMAAQAAGGYLATPTSEAENEFVFSLVDASEFWDEGSTGWSRGPWLGGFQNHNSTDYAEPAGGWEWVTQSWVPGDAGEPFTYANFEPDQPNDITGDQDHLHFATDPSPNRASTWNDANANILMPGYVIEWPPEPDPSEQVAEILDFVDTSVDGGTLTGDGPGNSAEKRLNALINMIEAAGDLVEDGDIEGACQQLLDAYKKTDGEPKPPDFVAGEAASELADMIQDLRATLGCE